MIPRPILTLLAFTILTSNHTLAMTNSDIRTVSVSGTAITRDLPDTIIWNVSLSEIDLNVVEAKQRCDKSVTALLALKEDLDIESSDIHTGNLRVSKEYERDDRGNIREFKGYRIRRQVTIVQRDLKRFDDFLSRILASGDREVSIRYESSKFHETRMSTRLEAVRVAQEKAKQMAEALGASLGKVLLIEERQPGATRPDWDMASNRMVSQVTRQSVDDLASGTFAPGAVEVRVTVYVTFEIE